MGYLEENHIVVNGIERYQAIDITFQSMTLKFKKPAFLCVENHIFRENSWGNLVIRVFNFLMKETETSVESFISFKDTFFDVGVFSELPSIGMKQLDCGLYISVNKQSEKNFVLLGNILNYFNVNLNKSFLLIESNSREEPSFIKDYIRDQRVGEFRTFLLYNGYDTEKTDKILHQIEVFDSALKKHNFRFDTILAVTDKNDLNYIKNEVLSYFKEEKAKIIERDFALLKDFFGILKEFSDETNIFTSYIIDGYGNVKTIEYNSTNFIFE